MFRIIHKTDIIIALLTMTGFLGFIPIFTYAYFAHDIQSKEQIMNRNNTGLTLLDSKGEPFFYFYQAKNRRVVPLSEISSNLVKAVIASEDKEYYQHPGFSVKAIIRSAIANIKSNELAQGGSTITQQLVKNSLLHPQKDFLRKYQEVVLASEIERKYNKEEILEMYLNSVYFGNGAFGAEEAAKIYFGKTAKDLSVAESALITSLLPSPSTLSPHDQNLEPLKIRYNSVLAKMVEQGYIKEADRDRASKEDLKLAFDTGDINSRGIHYALMVRDQLLEKYGEEQISRSGLKVKTTIDLDLQEFVEQAASDQVIKLAPNRVTNAAAVVLDSKTGEVKALVGSKNWYDDKFGKVNITTASRPPGSSFKPIIYAAALEKKLITPSTILSDNSTTFPGGYKPVDYDRRNRGKVTVRRALSNSLNIPAVEVMNKVGVREAIDEAKKFGITTLTDPSNYGLSLVLGAGEVKLLDLTGAYSVFANQGTLNQPYFISQIDDKFGNKIYTHQLTPKQVLDSKVAYLITSILSDSSSRKEVFGNTLDTTFPAAVKTGTTEEYKDSLTLGYTPLYTVGVWVGNNDNTPMDNVAGSLGAAPIWKSIMGKLHQGKNIAFTIPDGLSKKTVCTSNNKESTPSGVRTEYFLPGTEPKGDCNLIPANTAQRKPPAPPPNQPVGGPQITILPPQVNIQAQAGTQSQSSSSDSKEEKTSD